MFIIEKPSAYRAHHLCIIGEGETELAAWHDAYGKYLSPRQQLKTGAWATEITMDEYQDRLTHA